MPTVLVLTPEDGPASYPKPPKYADLPLAMIINPDITTSNDCPPIAVVTIKNEPLAAEKDLPI